MKARKNEYWAVCNINGHVDTLTLRKTKFQVKKIWPVLEDGHSYIKITIQQGWSVRIKE